MFDIALALVLDVLTSLPLVHRGETSPAVWLMDQALVLPLVFRRRYPEQVFLLVAVLASLQWLSSERLPADAALLLALYTVAAHRPRMIATIAAGVVELGVVLAAFRFAPTADGVLGSLILLTGMVAAAFFFGTSQRTRRQYLAALEDRALRLEKERDQQARLSASAERARIAREMHDIVAHNLSVMITLAEGAAAANLDAPTLATETMGQVATTGRQAMKEMRRLLGPLQGEEGDVGLEPLPGLGQVADLIEQIRATGLTVRLSVHGQPRPMSQATQLTVYRAVQEALTNTLKHARGATAAQVDMDWSLDVLDIRVGDDGRDKPGPEKAVGSGLGLSGMRARLAIHAGTMTAQAAPTGGWLVHVSLPLTRGESLR